MATLTISKSQAFPAEIAMKSQFYRCFRSRRDLFVVASDLRFEVAAIRATKLLRVSLWESGKKKAHKHKHINNIFRWLPGWGGSPDRVARGLPTGGQGSKVYVLCAEPKEHKHFRPDTRPGGSGTRPGGLVTGKHLLRQNFPPRENWVKRENFPSEGYFSLENSFLFPSRWPVFPWNKGFEKKEFLWLEGKFMTFPREREFTSSHFFASKDVMGFEGFRMRGFWVRYFRKPPTPPDPQSPKTPQQQKKKFQKTRKPRLSPKVNARSPKVNARSPKVNVRSPKVNVKYFLGIFEEFQVFEISCWGVTVTGVAKISKFWDSCKSEARKKSTKINFLGPETVRWGGGLPREGVVAEEFVGGGLPREGVVAEEFVPSGESLSSLGFEERNLGYPGNFAGMSRAPGGAQKFEKSLCTFFSSLLVLAAQLARYQLAEFLTGMSVQIAESPWLICY